MGWWSTGVLGGDTPLDWLGTFETILGIEDLYPLSRIEDPQAVSRSLTAHAEQLREAIAESSGDDARIGWQVIGALAVAVGARLEAEMITEIIAAARDDEWAREDRERAEDMAALISAVERCQETGAVTTLPTKGLFSYLSSIPT